MNSKSKLVFYFSVFCYCISVSCFALTEEQEQKVHECLKEHWHRVDYVKPLGFETIFNNLEENFWPALPESYEWRINENKSIELFKHKDAPDRNVHFVTYFTDLLDRFNFLSRWDGATQHSFAYTRKDLNNDGLRGTYPIDLPGYVCGHCIDFLDTQGISEISTCPGGYGSIIVESISTLDPRNYIPEPDKPRGYWGLTARRDFVKQIRQEGGTYAQYMYYFFAPPTTNGVAVPWGIYFVQTTPSVNSYNIPWPHPNGSVDPVHTGDANWKQRLKEHSNFFPAPFVYKVKEKNSFELYPGFPVQNFNLSYEQQYELFKAADHEVKSVIGKVTLVQYLLQCVRQFNNPIYNHANAYFIASWIERLIWHAEKLKTTYENKNSSLLLETNIRNLRDTLCSSGKENELNQQREDHQLITHLYGLLPENQMNIGGEITPHSTRTSSRLKSPAMPMVYVDGKEATITNGNLDSIVKTVEGMLTKRPPVHIRLINLSTVRAKNIWERLSSKFSATECMEIKKRISGTVDPDTKQKKFTELTDSNSPHFSPSAPLLFPINIDGNGITQEITSRIIETLTRHRVEHLLLYNLPFQPNEFLNILNSLWNALNEQEKTPGFLTRNDLHRLSNYTVAAGGFPNWIQDAFSRYSVVSAQILSNLQSVSRVLNVNTPSTIIISTSISHKSALSTGSNETINKVTTDLDILSIGQAQEEIELTSNSKQGISLETAMKTEFSNAMPNTSKRLFDNCDASDENDENAEYLNWLKMMKYEYTAKDISNFIKSNISADFSQFILGENGLEKPKEDDQLENIIYSRGSLYIFPIQSLHSLTSYMEIFYNSQFTSPPTDLIIPYNSGMHWTLLYIRVNENIDIEYVDSLLNENNDINKTKEENVNTQLTPLVDLLNVKLYPKTVILPLKMVNARLQKDMKACGPIIIENIKDIIDGKELKRTQLSSFDILSLRQIQKVQLESVNKKLDYSEF